MDRKNTMINRVRTEQAKLLHALHKAEREEESKIMLTYDIIADLLDEGLTFFPYGYEEMRKLVDSHKLLDNASIYHVIMEEFRKENSDD